MTDFPVPEYDNSILSVVSSVLHHYGVQDCNHPGQPIFDECLKKDPRNVVIMLWDGMGVNLLEKHLPEDSFLRSHMRGTVSSVFPPTTVAATTSIQSGLSPSEHGWLGWTLYFKEVDANVSTFSNKLSTTGKKASKESLAETVMPYTNVCDRIHACDPSVDALVVTPSKTLNYSIGSTCARVLHYTNKPGKHYIYSYWINPDHIIHQYGINSEQVHKTIVKINDACEKMCSKLKDTTIVILADHGLIDTKWLYLEDHPELTKMLVRDPSIETRAVSFFVKEEYKKEFPEAFK